MKRFLAATSVLVVAGALASAAEAKEVSAVKICGVSGCHAVAKEALRGFCDCPGTSAQSEVPAVAPQKYFVLRASLRGNEGLASGFKAALVAGPGLVRYEAGNQTFGWERPADASWTRCGRLRAASSRSPRRGSSAWRSDRGSPPNPTHTRRSSLWRSLPRVLPTGSRPTSLSAGRRRIRGPSTSFSSTTREPGRCWARTGTCRFPRAWRRGSSGRPLGFRRSPLRRSRGSRWRGPSGAVSPSRCSRQRCCGTAVARWCRRRRSPRGRRSP